MKRILATIAIAVVATTGCGGDGGDSVGADPGRAGAIDAATALLEATFSGDWIGVRSALTEECRDEYSISEIGMTMEFGLSLAAGFMGVERSDLERLEPGEAVFVEFVEGESATIGVELLLDGEVFASAEDDPAELVYVDGRWRSPDCDFDSGFDSGGAATPCDEVMAEGRPTDDVVADLEGPCDQDGTATYTFAISWDCPDGRELHYNDYGRGVSGGTWTSVPFGDDFTVTAIEEFCAAG